MDRSSYRPCRPSEGVLYSTAPRRLSKIDTTSLLIILRLYANLRCRVQRVGHQRHHGIGGKFGRRTRGHSKVPVYIDFAKFYEIGGTTGEAEADLDSAVKGHQGSVSPSFENVEDLASGVPTPAWPEAALAFEYPRPGQSRQRGLGSGLAWPRPRLLYVKCQNFGVWCWASASWEWWQKRACTMAMAEGMGDGAWQCKLGEVQWRRGSTCVRM